MTRNDDDFPLWAWAVGRYTQPGVADNCLVLQDRYGARVTLVLWLLWLDERGVPVSPSQLEDACRQVASVENELVVPLRRLRRQIRCWKALEPELEQAREHIKKAELLAEKAVLRRLAVFSAPWRPDNKKPATARGGLEAYLAGLGVSPVPAALRGQSADQ